jgi:hypothetical protein
MRRTSMVWVGVSPDDRTVVFPVIAQDSSTDASGHELLVLDVSSGSLRTVNNAYGPVGFTPDGSTIVSYTNGTTGNDAQLLLVDASTLEVQMADIPGVSAPSYYVTSGGDDVVIASNIGLTQLLVYDVSTHSYEKVGGPVVGLSNFVERASHDELWMLDDGLFRLELSTGALTQIPISWTPEDIDILPMHDLLVMDDSASGNIRYFDPSSETVTRTVLLPLAPAPDAGP